MTVPASPPPLRIGVIGCGALGLVHAQRLSALPEVHVCAVSDPNPEAMRRVAEAVPPEKRGGQAQVETFADYRDLLRQSGLDAISINSPNRFHVEQLLASLERGLHVLCEKPLSMVPEEVSRVVEATRASGRVVAIAYQSRYRRDSRILRRALKSGQWGRVTSVSIFACEDWVTPCVGTWRHDPAVCPGGYFADANGHQLDLLFWLTGLQANWVRATMETRGTPVPIVTWGEARLIDSEAWETVRRAPQALANAPSAQGVPFSFMFVGDAHQWREEISIQTERADFVMRDTRLLWTDGSAPLGPFPESARDPEDLNRPDTPDGAFIAALRGGPPVVSPPDTVWPVLRFTLAALDSAANGGQPTSTR
ncbi:MAG TPA: Gfo/Idh/MocA family oxidoreductase [Chthonomonadaceae bacterium]|nr:Gfo/Idh/MocA family oxidoreductase [Chthonomonadaceae bacterium]